STGSTRTAACSPASCGRPDCPSALAGGSFMRYSAAQGSVASHERREAEEECSLRDEPVRRKNFAEPSGTGEVVAAAQSKAPSPPIESVYASARFWRHSSQIVLWNEVPPEHGAAL